MYKLKDNHNPLNFVDNDEEIPRLATARRAPDIFYPYLEDTNIQQRKEIIVNCPEVEIEPVRRDFYCDDDIERQYLDSKPVSFIIIGKPNVVETELANLLAQDRKSVLITPRSVLEEEISSNSHAGQCIYSNLKCGLAIGPRVILQLVAKKILCEECKHRGFVLAGFPLVPNEKYIEPINSHSAVFTTEEIFGGPKREPVINVSEVSINDEVLSNDSNSSTSTLKPEYFDFLKMEDQLKYIFNLLKKPLVFIYIAFPNLDLLETSENIRYDYWNDEETMVDTNQEHSLLYFRLPHREDVNYQLNVYCTQILSFLEAQVLKNDPRHFIKVDCRVSAYETFGMIQKCLEALAFDPVVEPKHLFREIAYPEDYEEEAPVKENAVEYYYENLRIIKTVGPLYKRHLSSWGFFCPVAMQKGQLVKGRHDKAYGFLDKIYFLSGDEAEQNFCRNPRPYLTQIRCSCRIFVMGPNFSGKSFISTCLAYLFGGKLISLHNLEEELRQNRRKAQIERARLDAWNAGLATIAEQRRVEEQNAIEDWTFLANEAIQDALHFLNEDVSQRLTELNLPDDLEVLQSLLDDDNLYKYIPENIKSKSEQVTMFDPLVKNFVNVALESVEIIDNELTRDEKLDLLKTAITNAEEENMLSIGKRGGWVIDGFPTDLDFLNQLGYMADDIILLMDEYPNEFLIANYGTLKCYDKLFEHMEKNSSIVNTSKIEFVNNLIKEMKVDYNISIATLDNIKEYKEHLIKFTDNWNSIKHYFENVNVEPLEIKVTDKNKLELLKEIVVCIENKYRKRATVYFAEDLQNVSVDDEEDEYINEEEENDLQQTKRFGCTSDYCPVVYKEFNVLWKGKQKYGALYEDKLYVMSTESRQQLFLEDPIKYLLTEPPRQLPAPVICVTGTMCSGKTTISKQLAEKYKLHYVDFEELLLEILDVDVKNLSEVTNEETSNDSLKLLQDYLFSNLPLPSDLLTCILYRYWRLEPYKTVGLVIDNFPLRPTDVAFMASFAFIPDAIVELRTHLTAIHQRSFPARLQEWNAKQAKMKALKDEQNLGEYNEWLAKREKRFEEVYARTKEERLEERDPEGSGQDDLPEDDVANINTQLEEELPEPVFDDVWETTDEFLENLELLIDNRFHTEEEYIYETKNTCLEENIPWFSYENENSVQSVFFNVCKNVNKIYFRNNSIFERVYDIPLDEATHLLNQGYYFYSKFGRTCPVQLYENNFVQSHFVNQLRPVIHRRYIYFIVGDKSLKKFKTDPLSYTENLKDEYAVLPLKIAVIGPPKSGKSTLAARFQNELGLKLITRGQAIRCVLQHMPDTVLAKTIEETLKQGYAVTGELVADCVEVATHSATQGYVLDGFPNTQQESRQLAYRGIIPHIVFDLVTDLTQIEHLNSKTTNDVLVYSFKYVNLRYEEWLENSRRFREWLDHEFQNRYEIQNLNDWFVWVRAKKMCLNKFMDFHAYWNRRKYDEVLELNSLCITPEEFRRNQSKFKSYCPCCMELTDGGSSPHRDLLQFREYYYYVCPRHILEFTIQPLKYVSKEAFDRFPNELPSILNGISGELYENGACIVCFLNKRTLIKQETNFPVKFKDHTYLFCSNSCMELFLKNPWKYYDVVIHNKNPTPLVLPDRLPTIGYLEQYCAQMITEAIINNERDRPFHPFLGIMQCAAVNIGLFLKLNNPNVCKKTKPLYEEAAAKFRSRCDQFSQLIKRFKYQLNPYLDVSGIRAETPAEAVRPEKLPASTSSESCLTDLDYDAEEEHPRDTDSWSEQ